MEFLAPVAPSLGDEGHMGTWNRNVRKYVEKLQKPIYLGKCSFIKTRTGEGEDGEEASVRMLSQPHLFGRQRAWDAGNLRGEYSKVRFG